MLNCVVIGRASFSQLMVLAISQVLIGQASTDLGLDLAPAMEASTPGHHLSSTDLVES